MNQLLCGTVTAVIIISLSLAIYGGWLILNEIEDVAGGRR